MGGVGIKGIYMDYKIDIQTLENYGAHQDSGCFLEDCAYYKFKFGTTYVLTGIDRIQDAVAFAMEYLCQNNKHYKEFPVEWREWTKEDEEDLVKDELKYGEDFIKPTYVDVKERIKSYLLAFECGK
jgi:hypothetical protein